MEQTLIECLYIFSRQLQRDGLRDDLDPPHVPLHDHLLPSLLPLRRRLVDLLPHPQRGHSGKDGTASHTIPRTGKDKRSIHSFIVSSPFSITQNFPPFWTQIESFRPDPQLLSFPSFLGGPWGRRVCLLLCVMWLGWLSE